MKLIHNNQNNISVYHLLSLYIDENIDDYYLEDSIGRILSNEDIVKKDEKYKIKEKCRGGSSLNKSSNSFVITIGSSIIYGIVTILYYNYYITNILIGKYCDSPDNSNTNKKNIQSGGTANMNIQNNINKPEEVGTFKYLMKEYLKRFICHIKDTCYETFMSDSFPYRKQKLIKNNQTSLGSILSFAIFAVFIFMIMAPMFLNSATRISCGKPKMTSVIFSIIFILLPIVVCKLIPKIISLIEKLSKNKNVQNYKIAVSNTILLALLIAYMIISKKGLSKIMYGMFPIALIIFIGFKFIPGISDIIHLISKFFSNNITTISPPVSDDKPEEARRYTFFYTVFEIAIFSLIGWILYTIAFIGQVKEYCPT
jgi:hypothetical protein